MIRGVNLILQARHARYPEPTARLIEDRLLALGERCRAEQATVRLVHERDASPRFQVLIEVRLPGPDVHASACDHTAAVAAQKALRLIESRLAVRADRRSQRRRSNRQLSAAPRTGRAW
jgi:ribosome-associated translation inhibitor RaiA